MNARVVPQGANDEPASVMLERIRAAGVNGAQRRRSGRGGGRRG